MAKTKTNDSEIVQFVTQAHQASKQYKEKRQKKNEFNWDMYQLKQDFSHKKKGQSREFLPKLALGVEDLVSTLVTGLTNKSEEWFDVTPGMQPDEIFTADTIRKIMAWHLYNADAYLFLANSIKTVGLDSVVACKVHGYTETIERFHVERGGKVIDLYGTVKNKKTKVEKNPVKRWRLALDLIDFEDFDQDPYPNPTGPLYRMHTVERDLFELIETAEETGAYDMDVINKIHESFEDEEQASRKRRRKNQTEVSLLDFRKRVTIREYWGTILDRSTGKVKERNIVCTIANDKYLIRPPEKNRRLDGQDPFIVGQLLPVPNSQEGKAFLDAAAELNRTANEQYNLLMDGMFDAIKGIKQFRRGLMTNPRQVSGSIPTGSTIEIDEAAPLGAYVVEKVPTGNVPPDAFGFFRYTVEELNESMFRNELKLGGLPPASTKATVASIADQNVAGLFGGLSRIFEDKYVAPLLEKSWYTILENMDPESFAEEELINLLGPEKAALLTRMPIEERFARGSLAGKFRVRGISGIVNRFREFQKMTNLLQIIGSNPDLYQEYRSNFSMSRTLSNILSGAGIREDELKLTEEEKAAVKRQGQIQQLIASALSGSKGGSPNKEEATVEAQPQPMEGNA